MILENRYDKVMKNIEVSDEISDRILKNINNLELYKSTSKAVPFINYRKYLSIAASFLILVVGSVFIHNMKNLSEQPLSQGEMSIVNHSTVDELSQVVGFTVNEIQDFPFDVDTVEYISYYGELAEVKYTGQNNVVVLRIAAGSEDISGDHSEYTCIKFHTTNGYNVTIKGNDDQYFLALWQHDGFTYAVQFAEGVSEYEMLTTIHSLQ